jgi:hypothetical protein
MKMTAVEVERLEELRKIVPKTGAESIEWEKLESMVEPEPKVKEIKK